MSILLTFKNLNLSFGQKVIFDQAELTVSRGDRIGLIGLNGQGKSTLFNILKEKVKPDHTTPPFVYDKSNHPFEIFLIPQELNIEAFKHLSIENYYLAFYPKLYDIHCKIEKDQSDELLYQQFEELRGWDIQNSYINYLKGFDLNDLSRPVLNLSGGEQRKMALSIGLSSSAEFLLWDEPTNHLDIETIERFEDELLNSKKTYMIISHDRYLLNHTTDRIFHIEHGKVTNFKGTYLDYLVYLQERESELMKNLDKLENRHRRELAWMRQGIKARGTRSKKRVEGFHNIRDGIADIKSRTKKVVDLGLLHSGRKSKILIEIKDGSFSYDNNEILKDINILIAKKDKIALIGANGTGKSTLINIFQEKLILTDGKQKNAESLKVVVFDQNRKSLDENKTPMEIVGEGNDFVILGDGRKKHINSYLGSFLFNSDQVNRPVYTLSGGEKNRLQLAMFMKQAADLWVFDEPTNDLDIETLELLEKELKSYQSAVIIIGHDRAFLDNTCNTTWLINDKKIEIFEGGYTQVAPYLHALELEKKLVDKTLSRECDLKPNQGANLKLTNHEKQRLKVIESDISEAEKKLALINDNFNSFDFSEINHEKQKIFDQISSDKKTSEKLVNDLYEEWEILNSKL